MQREINGLLYRQIEGIAGFPFHSRYSHSVPIDVLLDAMHDILFESPPFREIAHGLPQDGDTPPVHCYTSHDSNPQLL